eukprot:gene4029-8020_t
MDSFNLNQCMNLFSSFLLLIILLLIVRVIIVAVTFRGLSESSLYFGYVKHSRLKGGSTHSMRYPLFLACIDIEEVNKVGWKLWPIFSLNTGWLSFSSLDANQHMKGWRENDTLDTRVRSYVQNKTSNKYYPMGSIKLVTHLTYFGYCFNPVSFYYIFNNSEQNDVDSIVVEVSNTPWIEQHIYVINENVDGVEFQKNKEGVVTATWNKEFHVSPFMEMDYIYNFKFSLPKEKISVNSKLLKKQTNELWFTANFELQQLPLTPLSLLYMLIAYPLHTRIIQIWIHYEAIKLWWKGIPLFAHPNNSDVNFGLGITGKRILFVFNCTQQFEGNP